jgi:hypothetical protein
MGGAEEEREKSGLTLKKRAAKQSVVGARDLSRALALYRDAPPGDHR